MKKNLCMLAILLTAGTMTAIAQIQQGNVLVGGDIANFNLGLNKGSAFSFQINPKAAWFVKDNTALGGYFRLGLSTAKGQGTDFLYGVGVLARSYVNGNAVASVRHTRAFLEANVGIEGENHSSSSTNNTTNGLGLGIGPGLAYFITPNIGLESLLKYEGIVGFGNKITTSNLVLSVGFQIYLTGTAARNAATNRQ